MAACKPTSGAGVPSSGGPERRGCMSLLLKPERPMLPLHVPTCPLHTDIHTVTPFVLTTF